MNSKVHCLETRARFEPHFNMAWDGVESELYHLVFLLFGIIFHLAVKSNLQQQ